MVEHGGHRVSHSCLLTELALICNLWQPYCDFSIVSTTVYLKAIMVVYGKHLQVWALKKNIRLFCWVLGLL